jgi:phosphatidylglycerol:prolipoprotein diacylglycerol transferase
MYSNLQIHPEYSFLVINSIAGLGLIIGYITFEKQNQDKDYSSLLLFNLFFSLFTATVIQNILMRDFSAFGKYGLTYYGAFLGIVISSLIYFNLSLSNTKDYLNKLISPLLLSHSIWRVGCYVGGCCYGICFHDH